MKWTADKFKQSKLEIDLALNQAVKCYFSIQTEDGALSLQTYWGKGFFGFKSACKNFQAKGRWKNPL